MQRFRTASLMPFLLIVATSYSQMAFALDLELIRTTPPSVDNTLKSSQRYQDLLKDLEAHQAEANAATQLLSELTGLKGQALQNLTDKDLQCTDVRLSLQTWARETAGNAIQTALPPTDSGFHVDQYFKSPESFDLEGVEKLSRYLEYGILAEMGRRHKALENEFYSSNQTLSDLSASFQVAAKNLELEFNQARSAIANRLSLECDVDRLLTYTSKGEPFFKAFRIGERASDHLGIVNPNDIKIFAGLAGLATLGKHTSLPNQNSLFSRDGRPKDDKTFFAIKRHLRLLDIKDQDIRWNIYAKLFPVSDLDRAMHLAEIYRERILKLNERVLECEVSRAELLGYQRSFHETAQALRTTWKTGEGEFQADLRPFVDRKKEIESQTQSISDQLKQLKNYKLGLEQCVEEQGNLSSSSTDIQNRITQTTLQLKGLAYSERHFAQLMQQMKTKAEAVIRAKRELLDRLDSPDAPMLALKVLTLTHALESDRSAKDLEKVLLSISAGFAGGVFDLKPYYEKNIEDKIWRGQETLYNVNAINLFDPVSTNRMQCYSGTLQFISALMSQVPSHREQAVLIFTDGHVLPGILENSSGKYKLAGVETTARGQARLDYGNTEETKGRVRVVTLNDFLIVEALKNDIANLKLVLDSTLPNLKSFGFKPEQLLAYEDMDFGSNPFSKLNQTPFAFGNVSLPEADTRRPHIDREILGPDFKDGYIVVRDYVDRMALRFYEFLKEYKLGRVISIAESARGLGRLYEDKPKIEEPLLNIMEFCAIGEISSDLKVRRHLDRNLLFSPNSRYELKCDFSLIYLFSEPFGLFSWYGFDNLYRMIGRDSRLNPEYSIQFKPESIESELCLTDDSKLVLQKAFENLITDAKNQQLVVFDKLELNTDCIDAADYPHLLWIPL